MSAAHAKKKHGRSRSVSQNDKEAQKLLAAVRRAPAQLTQEAMFGGEQQLTTGGNGDTRRAAIALLTKSGANLLDEVRNDRGFAVAVAGLFERLPVCISQLEGLMEILKCSRVSMMIALCQREDMDEFRQEAKIEAHGEEGHA